MVSTIAAVVVFVTTYALILPAITLESVAACGIEEHQHDDSCWSEVLACEIPESDGHQHTGDCYTAVRELVCEILEHEHSAENGCYDEDGNLVCSEVEHMHGDGCYRETRELTCGLEESEGHHHDGSCYEKVLDCRKEYHVHSAACYKEDPANSGSTESAPVAASTGSAAVEGNDASSSGSANGTGTGALTIEDNADGTGAEESATAATTNILPGEAITEDLSAGYVPALDPVDMDTVLNKHTGFYYFDASKFAEEHPDTDLPAGSTEIRDWQKYKAGTELENSDLLRLYLSYSIPAGTLNETNQVSRYRLPSNIRLTDDQIVAINETVNGIAEQYVDMSTLEITDPEKYEFYRGVEAIEGSRTPDQDVNDYLYNLVKHGESGEEYISAVVKAENVYDDEGLYGEKGAWIGQDLIFIWTPYSIEKNQNEFDKDGQPIKAGEKITGWFSCDFNMGQVEWESADSFNDGENEEKTAEVVLVNEDKSTGTKEISQKLTMVEAGVKESVEETVDDSGEGSTEEAAEGETEDAAADATVDDQNKDAEQDSTAETASEAATTGVTAEASSAGETADTASTAGTIKEEKEYTSGTLTAEGDGYKITLGYTAEAQIPENAYLSVREITAETDEEAYEACLEQAKQQVEFTDDKTIQKVNTSVTRFFDIEILAEDTVDVTVADNTIEETAVTDDNTDAVDADGTVSETADAVKDGNSTEDSNAVADDTAEAVDAEASGTEPEKNQVIESEAEQELETEQGSETEAETVVRKIEPAAPVNVNIQILDAAADGHTVSDKGDGSDTAKSADVSADPTILHFAEKGVETIESTTIEAVTDETPTNEASSDESAAQESGSVQSGAGTGTAVQFQADSFSIYGVVYTTITTTILTATGETYEITVDYDEDAEIPDDAELKVREILPEDEEYEEIYQEAFRKASEDAADHGIDLPMITGPRLFDIEIHADVDGKDTKIEPAAPVQVNIRLKDAGKADMLSVIHFAEDGAEIMSVQGPMNQESVNTQDPEDETGRTGDAGQNEIDGQKESLSDTEQTAEQDTERKGTGSDAHIVEVTFETDAFSVYTVMPVSSLDNFLDSAQYALVSQRGPDIGSAEAGNKASLTNYAMTSSTNGTTLSGKGVHLENGLVGGDVTEWGFEKSGNQYLIYTGSESSKQYVRVNGASLELTNDQNQATGFTVTVDDGKVRFGANYAYITNTGNNPSQFTMGYYATDDTLFTLARLDPDYEEQAAKKVAAENWKASGNEEGKWNESSTVVIYRRIVHDDGSENLYALATDGSLIPAYDGGDSIFYHCPANKNVNWHVARNDNGYYYIESVVPAGSAEQKVYLAPSATNGTWKSDEPVGLTLNGLGQQGSYGTRIEVWDQAEYAYAGLHVDATDAGTIADGIKIGIAEESDTFLFAVSDTLISDNVLHTVDTLDSTSLGIKMKIFNYGGPTYNWTYRNAAMQAVMGDDMLSDWDTRKSHVTKTVAARLDGNGFPVSLSNGNSYKPLFTGGSTINYNGRARWDLTSTGYEDGSITVYEHAANNLFLQSYYDESQTFRYSSMENFAHFNTSGTEEGNFTVYREAGTPNVAPTQNDHYYFYHGHFMPFNTLDPSVSVSRIVDQYGSITDKDEGRAYENVYGLAENDPDYYVGMSMEARFVQPSDGKLENGDPVVYRFTGDDDLLVYIDDILVLDVGGIHEPLTGSINFETGVVTQPNFYGQGDGWKHTETTLYNIFHTAYKNGVLSDAEWNKLKWKDVNGDGTPDTFADFTTHSFNMFYMERGAGASNLDLMFNLQVVKKDEFTVRKQLPEGIDSRFVNQSFRYQATFIDDTITDDPSTEIDERIKPLHPGATKSDGTSVCESVIYKDLKDPDTGQPIIKNVAVDNDGYFVLKAGEAAVFKMSNDNIEYDVNVKETMVDPDLISQIDINNDTSVEIVPDSGTPANGNIAEAGFENVSERGEVIYTNHPYTRNLNITKHLTEDSAPLEPGEMPVFEFRVYLERTVEVTAGDPPQPQTVHRLEPYSYGPYYVTKEVNGVVHYYKLNGLNNAPVDQGTEPVVCSTTGRSGSINSIPPEYTIVVPDLAIGTNFYVEERLDNLPAGYEFVREELKPGTFGTETLTNESLSSQDVINRILARDENDHQQFDPSTIGAIIKTADAESHVYNRKKSIDLPLEKSWSPSAPAAGTEVTLALVRFKAPASSTYTPPSGKGAVRINHMAKYGNSETTASLPGEFVATYTVRNKSTDEVVVPETLSAGPFDLDPGTYTVTAHVIRSADPEGYAYDSTDPVDVTVTANQTSDATLTSTYSKVTSGFIEINHTAAGLSTSDLPDGFTAVYSIKNAAGQYVHVNVPADKYAVAPGAYTVEIDLTDPAAPAGYSHRSTTSSVNVDVVSEGTKEADFTSTYVQNGKIVINHTATGLPGDSTTLPAGFSGTYTITGPTTIENAVVGQAYSVTPGNYTVSMHLTSTGAPAGYSYVKTEPVDVTVNSGETPAAANLLSEYMETPEDGYIKVVEKFVNGSGNEIQKPNGFSSGYNISGPTAYQNVNAGESKYVEPGVYTVSAIKWTDPSGDLAYIGADDVEVTVTGGTTDVTVTHRFGTKGTLTVVPKSSGLPGNTTDLPEGFSARYKATNVSTGEVIYIGQDDLNSPKAVAPGKYTVELDEVYYEGGNNIPKYYSRAGTPAITVTVPSGGNANAEIISEYTYTAPEMKTYTVTVSSWKDKNNLDMESGPEEGSITIPIHGLNSKVAGTVTLNPLNNWTAEIQLPIGEGNNGNYYINPQWDMTLSSDILEVTPVNDTCSHALDGTFTVSAKWDGSVAPDITYTLSGTWKDAYGNTLTSEQLPTSGAVTVKIIDKDWGDTGKNFVLAPGNWTSTVNLPYGEGKGVYKIVNDNQHVSITGTSVKSIDFTTASGTDTSDASLIYTAVANDSPYATTATIKGFDGQIQSFKYNSTSVKEWFNVTNDGTDLNVPLKVNNTAVNTYTVTVAYYQSAPLYYKVTANNIPIQGASGFINNANQTISFAGTGEGPIVIELSTSPIAYSGNNQTLAKESIVNIKDRNATLESDNDDRVNSITTCPRTSFEKRAFRSAANEAVVLNPSLTSDHLTTSELEDSSTAIIAPAGASFKENPDIQLAATSPEGDDPSGGTGGGSSGSGGSGTDTGTGTGNGSSAGTSNVTDINPMSVEIPQSVTDGLPAGAGYTLDVSFGKGIVLNGNESPEAWKQIVSKLAEYDIYGTPYYYAIVETSVPEGYEVSYGNPNPISAVTIRQNMDARAAAQAAGTEPPSLVTLQAINTRDIVPGNLVVEKKVSGLTDTASTFTFQITLTSSGTGSVNYTAVKTKADNTVDAAVTSVTFTDGTATVSLKANEKIEIQGLPDGTTYAVTETGTLPTGYEQGTHTNASGTIHDSQTTTVTMNNIYTVSLDIIKVDETNTSKKIPGAQFTIRRIKDTLGGNGVEYDGAESDPITTDGNGTAQFTGIRKGYYEVYESRIPDGYVTTGDNRFYIFVDEGNVRLLVKNLEEHELKNWTSTQTTVGNVSLAAKTATVTNEPGAELPASGGMGTRLIYLLGGMLTGIALLLLPGRKRIRA